MKYLLILGAKSDMAKAYAKFFASKGYALLLAGRKIAELKGFKNTLENQNKTTVKLYEFDVLNLNSHRNFIATIAEKLTGVICCIGYLGDQKLAENSADEALLIWNTNFVGCASILSVCADQLQKEKNGFIIGISSVAGERGRKSNYFYGSAKAGLTAYLSGLRASLSQSNVQVLTVKPGFVYTKMTAHLHLPKLITTSPEWVAKTTYNALKKKKNVVYIKWIWRYIMIGINLIPEFLFKRMNI